MQINSTIFVEILQQQNTWCHDVFKCDDTFKNIIIITVLQRVLKWHVTHDNIKLELKSNRMWMQKKCFKYQKYLKNIYTYNSPQLWKHWPWKVLGVDTELVAYILFTKRNGFFPLLTSHYSSGDNSLRGSRTEQHSGFINTALSVISSKGHHQLKVNSTNPELFYLLNATHHHLLLFFPPSLWLIIITFPCKYHAHYVSVQPKH